MTAVPPETAPCDPDQQMAVALERVARGDSLDRRLISGLLESVLSGRLEVERFGAWLDASADLVPTAEEIAGVVDVLRRHMRSLPIDGGCGMVIDTCGTGGDGSGTFNISTAAALVAAAAGLRVAKHGNRAVSSRSGSADVLEALGVKVDLEPARAAACLASAGICFCFAPTYHPALAVLGPLRRRIGRPTVFNLVGPLVNPAGATVQVIGVGRAAARESLAEAARLIGLRRAVIVADDDGVDEVGLFSGTDVIDVTHEGSRRHRWHPEDFGIATAAAGDRASLIAADPTASAGIILGVLAGEHGPPRDVVVLNAAAALWAAAQGETLSAARALAEEAIDSGAAAATLARLVVAAEGG